MKKQSSYTYWVDEKNKSRDLPPQQQPKKIEVVGKEEQKVANSSPSPWNTSGTWEEKKISINEFNLNVQASLVGWLEKSEEEVKVSEVKIEGELHLIFKRGKKNMMYELKGKVEFEKEEKKGKLKLEELTDHGDREYKVTGNETIRPWVSQNAEKILQIIEEQIAAYK